MTTSGRSCATWAERLAAVGHDVEQLDLRLRVEQPADVLGDLRDVLDQEEADLASGHRPDDTTLIRPSRLHARIADRAPRCPASGP